MMNTGSRGQCKHVAAMVVVNLALGVVNVLAKQILNGGLYHMVFVAYRQSVAFFSLAPIAYCWERKSRPRFTAPVLCYLFLGALLGITFQQYFFLLGLKHTSPTFSSAFMNTVPVATFMIALIIGQEKLNLKSKAGKSKVLGAIICLTGAILLALYKGEPLIHKQSLAAETDIRGGKEAERWALGSMLLMASSILWSSWFIIQGKVAVRYPCQYSSTAALSFFAAIQSAVLCFILERKVSIWILKDKLEVVGVIYGGIVATGLSYVLMSWCVKQRGPVFTAAFSPLTQIFTAMFDLSILHQQLCLGRLFSFICFFFPASNPQVRFSSQFFSVLTCAVSMMNSVLGSMVVVLGLYILLWGKSIEEEDCAVKQTQPTIKANENYDAESQGSVAVNSSIA